MNTTEKTIQEIAAEMKINPVNVENWVNMIQPYAADFLKTNGVTYESATPDDVVNAVCYASQQVKNLMEEIVERKTCRAKVAYLSLSLTVWYESQDPGEDVEALVDSDILADSDLIEEFGFDNVQRSLNSLRNKGM